jgi:hypothetical protein
MKETNVMNIYRRHKSSHSIVVIAAMLLASGIPIAEAASEPSWLKQADIKGFVSAYDWTSINHYFSPYDQYTLSVGGGLFLGTPYIDGFRAAIEPMGQSGLGTHASNPNLVSPTLGPSFSTLGQAFVQYKDYGLNARVGYMELNDQPWAASDVGYRILPITFEGVAVNYDVTKNLSLYATRIFRWRYFNQALYHRETAYSIYLPGDRKASSGFMSAGVKYKGVVNKQLGWKTDSELWFYNFYQYARMYMAQSVNTFDVGAIKPILGIQFMHSGKQSGFLGNVNAQLYGVEAGAKNGFGKIILAYDYLPGHAHSFNYGGLVTPYDTITDSGPIFAQPVMSSTQDFGSGSAATVKLDYYGIPELFTQLRYTYLHMRTSPEFQDYREFNLILSYSPGWAKGINLTDIASYANESDESHPNFYQNRLMLVYKF